ncbi:MAG: hypothetical protein ACR5K4_01930 [Sodalis sp. (in: enterobacteria)]
MYNCSRPSLINPPGIKGLYVVRLMDISDTYEQRAVKDALFQGNPKEEWVTCLTIKFDHLKQLFN